jgi:Fumarase C C-terminus
MLATALVPLIGYDKASQIAHHALEKGLTDQSLAIQVNLVAVSPRWSPWCWPFGFSIGHPSRTSSPELVGSLPPPNVIRIATTRNRRVMRIERDFVT